MRVKRVNISVTSSLVLICLLCSLFKSAGTYNSRRRTRKTFIRGPTIEIGVYGQSPHSGYYAFALPEQRFRIGIIADLDLESADQNEPGKFLSYLREGTLIMQQNKLSPSRKIVTVQWNSSAVHTLKSGLAYFGRGMELSTLNVFNGRLLACEDKSGIIYEMRREDSTPEVIPTPWVILAGGNYSGPGFRCEWATEKDGDLYVGANGRNLVDNNGKVSKIQKFVKKISETGEVSHLDWTANYEKIDEALNIRFPGYIVHEAVGWSDALRQWMFLPRYISYDQPFDPISVRYNGANVVITCDEHFENIEVSHIGANLLTHGFTSFKWVPGTKDQIVVALRVSEVDEKTETFIIAFDMQGNVILPETKFADQKYEGIEFL